MLKTTASVANNIIIINKIQSLLPLAKPFNTGSFGQNDQLHFPIRPNAAFLPLYRTTYGRKTAVGGARRRSRVVVAAAATTTDIERSVTAKAVVSVKLDGTSGMLGKTLLLEIVSAEVDHRGAQRRSRVVVAAAATTTDIERSVTAKAVVSVKLDGTSAGMLETGSEKETIKAYAHRVKNENGLARYEASFKVPPEFGEVGAVLVENEHDKEMFLTDVVLDGLPFGSRRFPCNSWVQSKFDSSEKRIFFSDKSYLPSQTPDGLKRWRERELENLRGDGFGERKSFERIYDYDTYNDLGDPDTDPKLARPVLGGKNLPYPRRCRTGRPRSKTDPLSESRSASVYVPRDEQFSETKMGEFPGTAVQSVLHAVVPSVEAAISDPELSFPSFTAIDLLFDQGLSVPGLNQHKGLATLLPRLVKAVSGIQAYNLRFEPPAMFDNDRFAWLRDEEFSRQTLAGLNPCSIKLVTEWPLVSKLDPEIYGPPESAITKELVEGAITDFMTLEEAIAQKKLFVLDYHDAFLSYVNKVRELKGTTLYGSRTLFFLTQDGSLRPLAIELARPPIDGKRQWKEVFTPSSEATSSWLWRLAKAHVLAHDSGYHQLISHWLRTHCCTEPYIIAANRQLSAMHPIYRLLRPHFRYTMMMNALARLSLINADGVIESTFSPGKYSFEMCSIIYGSEWRFDHQSLPSDLISRGMAEEDPSSPHGLKLTIEDYPFANDGLVLWDSIKQWVTDYVNHYYPEPTLIQSDQELQAWWTEIRTIGHGDKKDEPWWPNLNTNHDLIEIITNIVWVASGLHAAVNFGQYAYAGYFPNRPTVTRTKIPREDPSDAEWEGFLDKPEQTLLRCFPSQMQATKVMSTLDVLSNHSPDEEYIGDKIEPAWEAEPVIKAAFEKFQGRLKELDRIIDERNANSDLKNRSGAGVVPYELLKPLSEPGVTGMGVPNSISV